MAATLYRAAAATPMPTPAPTVFIPPFRGMGRRFDNTTMTTTGTTRGPDCAVSTARRFPSCTNANGACPFVQNFNGFQTCSAIGDYGSCLASNDAGYCGCNDGIQYLGCVSAAIATSSCQGAVAGVGGEGACQRPRLR